jgi:hypothetical protein
MKQVFRRPYLYFAIGLFISYLALNVYISQFYTTIPYIGIYAAQVKWGKLILGMALSLLIAGLVAINSVYGYILYKRRKLVAGEGVIACVGTIGGLATGVCSSCVTSVFHLILGLFGVTFSWAALPFEGIEVQVLMVLLLGLNLWWMRRRE